MRSLKSRDLVFGRKFYIVEVQDTIDIEIYNWTVETFGPPEQDDRGHRWFISDGEMWFHKQSDRDWLIMRWS